MKILRLDSKKYNDLHTFEEKFFKMCDTILNKYALRVNDELYEFMELEVYLYCDGHLDPYVHKAKDQSIPEMFYFHKSGNSYKGGTYKGLDITFGFKEKEAYGGILVRSIRKIGETNTIEGPCKTVDKILEICKKDSIQDLVGDKQMKINNDILKIEKHNMQVTDKTIRSPRVGLKLKKPPYEEYTMKRYRYTKGVCISKYKPLILLSTYLDGDEYDKKIETYIEEFKKDIDLNEYYGKNMTTKELIRVYGKLH